MKSWIIDGLSIVACAVVLYRQSIIQQNYEEQFEEIGKSIQSIKSSVSNSPYETRVHFYSATPSADNQATPSPQTPLATESEPIRTKSSALSQSRADSFYKDFAT
jgi:hypothetical protein